MKLAPPKRKSLKNLLTDEDIVFSPIVFDPLSARVVELLGCHAVSLGGYAVGAHLMTTEPLTTLTEMAEATRQVTSAIRLPVLVDGGAGFGEPLHVMRTVRELEKAGAAGVHIEDQLFPKRMHYHRDYKESVVAEEEMVDKIRFAIKARESSDFLIVARTDSIKTEGVQEGIGRARSYTEAGAEMIMAFPNTLEEARLLPKKVDAPLIYVNAPGNRVGRPVLSINEAKRMGYRLLTDSVTVLISSYVGVRKTLAEYLRTGIPPIGGRLARKARLELENEMLRMPDYYAIEEETTVGKGPGR